MQPSVLIVMCRAAVLVAPLHAYGAFQPVQELWRNQQRRPHSPSHSEAHAPVLHQRFEASAAHGEPSIVIQLALAHRLYRHLSSEGQRQAELHEHQADPRPAKHRYGNRAASCHRGQVDHHALCESPVRYRGVAGLSQAHCLQVQRLQVAYQDEALPQYSRRLQYPAHHLLRAYGRLFLPPRVLHDARYSP
ncbi:hypothetical protein D3C85_1346900 [compost metagenome]